MENKIIMLVDDNPDDVYLTLRAFKKNNINNKVIVAKNAREALDYLFRQGNYESLSGEAGPLFFLLKAKCAVVAQDLGVRLGDAVLMRAGSPHGPTGSRPLLDERLADHLPAAPQPLASPPGPG